MNKIKEKLEQGRREFFLGAGIAAGFVVLSLLHTRHSSNNVQTITVSVEDGNLVVKLNN